MAYRRVPSGDEINQISYQCVSIKRNTFNKLWKSTSVLGDEESHEQRYSLMTRINIYFLDPYMARDNVI